jgi:hypothetical protein
MNAGNALQVFDQAQLNDQKQRYEDQRDFELEQRKGYQSGILGKAPQTSNKFQANLNNPYAAALGGGMAGFGFQQEYFPQVQQGTGSFFRGRTANPHMR